MSHWQPISYLTGAGEYIDSYLGGLQDRLSMFEIAQGKPHAIDDQALQKCLSQHRQFILDAQVPEAQLERWLSEPLTPLQRTEVERLVGQMKRWRELCLGNIELVEKLLHQNATHTPDRLAAAEFYIEIQCRPYASLSPQTRRDMPFVLPPEVMVTRAGTTDKVQSVYRFEHQELGFLGEITMVRGADGVRTDAWVNDEAPGKVGQQRRRVFIALTDHLMKLLQDIETRNAL